MREAERYTLLAKAAEELRDKEERLRERIMLSHVAREWRGDLYVRRLREDARGEYALEIVREEGLGALRPEAWETEEEGDPGLREVRALVWQKIDTWYGLARGDDVRQRREAAKLLKRLGAVLSGDRRGRRTRHRANPVEVLYHYRRNVLRLKHALEMLPQVTGWERAVRIAKVADACGIPADILHQHLPMSEADEKPRRPLPLQHTARIWTAQTHGITEQTVSNLVSKLTSMDWMRDSRK
jgi:hypothetical protein